MLVDNLSKCSMYQWQNQTLEIEICSQENFNTSIEVACLQVLRMFSKAWKSLKVRKTLVSLQHWYNTDPSAENYGSSIVTDFDLAPCNDMDDGWPFKVTRKNSTINSNKLWWVKVKFIFKASHYQVSSNRNGLHVWHAIWKFYLWSFVWQIWKEKDTFIGNYNQLHNFSWWGLRSQLLGILVLKVI